MPTRHRPRPDDPRPGERVSDGRGELRCLAYAEGWVLCRRKGCIPDVMYRDDWVRLRAAGAPADARA